VWIMTGYDAARRDERLASRVHGVLQKPLSTETLFQTLVAGLRVSAK
jgi:hypothetical protein